MWRLKSLVVLMVVATVLLMGTAVAQAWWGWWWNAEIAVEGVDVRTEWMVNDPNPDGFRASIEVKVPKGAEANLITQADNETVVIIPSGGLECTSTGIEAEVRYRVVALGPVDGPTVLATIKANGQVVGSAAGTLNEGIALNVLIPATNPDCS